MCRRTLTSPPLLHRQRQGNADKALETLRALEGGQYGAGARPSEMSYVLVMQVLALCVRGITFAEVL
jgi:hypothetical protein